MNLISFLARIAAVYLTLLMANFPAANANIADVTGSGLTIHDLPATAQFAISATLGKQQAAYHIRAEGEDTLAADNPRQALASTFTRNGVYLGEGTQRWRLELSGLGYGTPQPIERTVLPKLVAQPNRVEYQHPQVTEWYVNGPFGLQQGFTLEHPPALPSIYAQRPQLELRLRLQNAYVKDNQSRYLTIQPTEGPAWRYGELVVYDTNGVEQPARLQVDLDEPHHITLAVDDSRAVYPLTVDPYVQTKKLTASDAAGGDGFGISVSIDGDTIIVGAYEDDDNGFSSGSAYVFYRNQGGADNWGQVKKLLASDASGGDSFGSGVSISGDIAIVGAYEDDDNGFNSGSAYVFYRNQGGADNWGQVKKLLASDGASDDDFGRSVSISGGIAIVGAYGDDDKGSNSGSAYLFSRDQGGVDNWGQLKKITASDGSSNNYFGQSVSVSGDTAVVGATQGGYISGTSPGSAYIFERNQGGVDNWGEVTEILASDGAHGDAFGQVVSIRGDLIVVGAIKDDDNGSNSGSAYLFSRNEGGANNWGEVTKILPSDGAEEDWFGSSVSVNGNTTIVGVYRDDDEGLGSGSAYVFTDTPTSIPDDCTFFVVPTMNGNTLVFCL